MGREELEDAERRGEGLLTEERASWTSEQPDPRVFAGDEKRELLFSLAFAQWAFPPPPNYFACLNIKM